MFSLPPELLEFRLRVRAFASRHVAPAAADIDEQATYPTEIHRAFVDEGLMHPIVMPPEGGTTRFLRRAILVEELAYVSAAVSMIPIISEMGCMAIQLFGNARLKTELLGGVGIGFLYCSYGLNEPQAGSDVAALKATARHNGSEWIIRGEKSWICNVRQPGYCVVFARTGESREALSAFAVPTDSPGFELMNPEPTLGLRGAPMSGFRLNDVRVSGDRLIGKPGDGFRIAMSTMNHSRAAVAAQALGIARAAHDAALERARRRKTFGQPLIDHQAVGFMLADMSTRIRAARHLVYEANSLLDEKPGGDPIATAGAKTFASDTAMQVATDAVQIFGGEGYSRRHPVERFFRDAKATQIYDGTNQIQRMVIARRLAAGGSSPSN